MVAALVALGGVSVYADDNLDDVYYWPETIGGPETVGHKSARSVQFSNRLAASETAQDSASVDMQSTEVQPIVEILLDQDTIVKARISR